jgi:hypothetical protein
MNNREKDYSSISETVNIMRNIQRVGANMLLNESEDNGEQHQGAVPYTNQDELLKNSLQPCRVQFGADFSKLKTPMLYYLDDSDITLSGIIPSLNNAKFQYRYLKGCFLWLDSIQLTDETIDTIKKVYGVFKNWREQLKSTEDKKPLAYKNEQ